MFTPIALALYETIDIGLIFRVFIDYFKEDALPDKHVHLTVVYYGNEGLSEIQDILGALKTSTGFNDFNLVTANDEFSRGKGEFFSNITLFTHVSRKNLGVRYPVSFLRLQYKSMKKCQIDFDKT